MSAPKRANDMNLGPCWKVRVYVRECGAIHLLSKVEPVVTRSNGEIKDVAMDIIAGTEYGDTIGYIDWNEVSSITWRFAPSTPEKHEITTDTTDPY